MAESTTRSRVAARCRAAELGSPEPGRGTPRPLVERAAGSSCGRPGGAPASGATLVAAPVRLAPAVARSTSALSWRSPRSTARRPTTLALRSSRSTRARPSATVSGTSPRARTRAPAGRYTSTSSARAASQCGSSHLGGDPEAVSCSDTVATEHLLLVGELARVLHQEARPAHELVGLLGQDPLAHLRAVLCVGPLLVVLGLVVGDDEPLLQDDVEARFHVLLLVVVDTAVDLVLVEVEVLVEIVVERRVAVVLVDVQVVVELFEVLGDGDVVQVVWLGHGRLSLRVCRGSIDGDLLAASDRITPRAEAWT